MNTTDEFWEVNGTSLQTLAFNVETWGGSLQAPPVSRGSDVIIPFKPGQIMQKRVPGARVMSFSMWVIGADENGLVPTDKTMRQAFEKNWFKLRELFWNQSRPLTLTRRWREPGSSEVIVAHAEAIFSGGLAPTMVGRGRAIFTVDLLLPDPFFYGDLETIEFPAGTASVSVTPEVLGHYETDNVDIQFSDRADPRLTNVSDQNSWVQLNTNLTGSTADVSVSRWTATSGGTNMIGAVTFQGQNKNWFTLHPGSQQLILSGASGTGGATITYRPKWL